MLSSSFPVSERDKHAGGELVFNRSTLPKVCAHFCHGIHLLHIQKAMSCNIL